MTTSFSQFAKYLAWFAIANGVLAMASPLLFGLFLWLTLSEQQRAMALALGLVCVLIGFYGLCAKPRRIIWWVYLVVLVLQAILFVQWATVPRVWMG